MNPKIIILILASFIFTATSLHLSEHLSNYDTCFFVSLGHINTLSSFNYTITKAWTAEQTPLLKNGSLNTSDFIHVSGWAPYSSPVKFFSDVAKKGQKIVRKLTFVKDVLHGADAPQFYLSDADL